MKDKRIAIASVSASVILMASAAQADTRPKPWQSINMSEAPVTVGIPDGEWDGIRIGVSESGAPNLKKTYERLQDDPGYIALKAKTDAQDEKIDEMLDRLDALREKNRHWEAAPELTEVSSWVTVGPGVPNGPWSPAISGQLTDFVQTRPLEFKQERTFTYYDKIVYEIGYGEGTRVSSTRTEEQRVPGSESRMILVSTTSWANVGGLYDCTTWSPATNTVDQGTEFTQTRTCQQNQQRNVSYTVASTGENPGGAWTDTRTIDVDQTRSATGTKATTGEWFLAGAIAVNSPNIGSDPYFFHDGYSQSHWNGAPTYSANDAPWPNPWLNTDNRACQPLGDKFIAVVPMGPQGYRRIFFVVCR